MTRLLGFSLLLACVGCTNLFDVGDGGVDDGGNFGSASLSGDLAFTVGSAYGLQSVATNGNVLALGVTISTLPWSCDDFHGRDTDGGPPPSPYTRVVATIAGNGVAAPPAGTYQVLAQVPYGGYGAGVEITFLGDAGAPVSFGAQSGTVTLSDVETDEISGSFDVTLVDGVGNQSELQGSFDSPFCQ